MDNETNNKIRLLYEWNAKYDKLNFAIREAEFQLDSVNKRLRMLWYDLAVYAGMIVFPFLLIQLLLLLPYDPTAIVLILLMGFRTLLTFAYVFSLPFTVAYLIKSIGLLVLNSESRAETDFIQPIPQGVRRGAKIEHAPTYRMEQKKLVYVLSRYYLSRDAMDELRQQLDSENCTITLEELKERFKQYPLYEEILPANMNKLWKRYLPMVLIVFAILCIYLVIQVIISFGDKNINLLFYQKLCIIPPIYQYLFVKLAFCA